MRLWILPFLLLSGPALAESPAAPPTPQPIPIDPALMHDLLAVLNQQMVEKCGNMQQVAQQLMAAAKAVSHPATPEAP